jgi:feruloyl esterase
MVRSKVFLLASLPLSLLLGSHVCFGAEVCSRAADLHLFNLQVTSAEEVSPNSGANPEGLPKDLLGKVAAFCRVRAVAKPTADSEIHIEVWIPSTNWNGRFWGIGNGGFGGSIDFYSMANLIRRGFATAGTDTGHAASASNATWALGHPEKIEDFGWRAIHLMTVTARAVISEITARTPDKSYFGSCSTGGRQALMEVQRFPRDYDGVLAGAPANYWTGLLAAGGSDMSLLESMPDSYVPPSDVELIHDAVVKACHVENGVVPDPTRCSFNPEQLLCSAGQSSDCLNKNQVQFLKRLYLGLTSDSDGIAFPGYEPGGELGPGGWSTWLTGSSPGVSLMAVFVSGYYANFVFNEPNWRLLDFDLRATPVLSRRGAGQALDATATNLAAFRNRGGKLIIYHGWSDPAIPPLSSVHYFNDILKTMGAAKSKDFLRLYMIPGMQHCVGGDGADSFGQEGPSFPATDSSHNIASALMKWVEAGESPSSLVATKYDDSGDATRSVKFTQLLCQYPLVATYTGMGDMKNADNYSCKSSHSRR